MAFADSHDERMQRLYGWQAEYTADLAIIDGDWSLWEAQAGTYDADPDDFRVRS